MDRYSKNFSGDSGSLVGRVVALLFGIGAFVLSLVLGAVFLAAIVGFMLLIGLIVGVRVWWMQRKMARYQSEHGDLDGEYTVITREERITRDDRHR